MIRLPTLYKKTKTGAVQFWEIFTNENRILTLYGQLGTDSPQKTEDVIKDGKNAGRANATTASEQADKEADARWKKQIKKGYVEDRTLAEAGENALEGVPPMLAHSYAKHAHKIQYPAALQPKLDGIRCLAIVKGGKCTLWSRTRKPITGVPHIVAHLESLAEKHGDFILDGELYNHEYKNDFEKIVSIVRQQKEVAENHTEVQYHVYDMVSEEPFYTRILNVAKILNEAAGKSVVGIVFTILADDEPQSIEHFLSFRDQGYEGAMIRNLDGIYAPTRSYDLQKIKEMQEEEFKIVGIKEGRGKLAGHAATFTCVTKDGQEFDAKLCGSLERLKEYFNDHTQWAGKQLTVQFQKLSAYGIPIFPVGKVVRDYE